MNAKAVGTGLAVVAIGVGAYQLHGLHDPPGQEECELIHALVQADAGLAYETVDVCGADPDGGEALPSDLTRELGHQGKRARNGKAIGLHRHEASGCACAPVAGVGCEWLRPVPGGTDTWEPAPPGSAHQPGRWRGGCVPLPTCVEAAELGPGSAMPTECRLREE